MKERWKIGIDFAKDEDYSVGYTINFRHIHNTNGFAISKALTQDGKDYIPQSTHACLDYGYFCIDHIREHPTKIFRYIESKLYRLYRFFRPYNWKKHLDN